VNPEPSLLIIARLADDFDLTDLPWSETASAKISINRAKFKNLEMVEVIVDAMPFQLSRLTAAETSQRIAAMKDQWLSTDTLSPADSAIGVALTGNLTGARHLPQVNQRLLLLGKWIGESLDASAAAWMPSQTILSFVNFREAVEKYPAGGALPFSDK